MRRFLAWAEWKGEELAAITPGMVGPYLVGLGGSPAKRTQHLAALRGFFDRWGTDTSASSIRPRWSKASRSS